MNIRRLLFIVLFLLGGAALALPSPILAQTTCSAQTSALSHGNYDPLSPTPLDRENGSVTVRCGANAVPPAGGVVPYTIALSPGASGNFGQRLMNGPSIETLAYNLFSNSSRSSVWGDSSAGTVLVPGSVVGIAANTTVNGTPHTVYSRIPARQYKPPGAYNDTINVTISF